MDSASVTTTRLDAFTDAAFAFAVTLLVIGGTDAPRTMDALGRAMADVPAFAIAFATIAMFWFAHVRWRAMRGAGGAAGTLLTFLLVFLLLIYVQPLRSMSVSFSAFAFGIGPSFSGSIADLFALYGVGFAAMAAVTAMLFADAARAVRGDAVMHRVAIGDVGIWSILAGTGALSVIMSLIDPIAILAPFAYATLPISVGLFTWAYYWRAKPVSAE